MLLEIIYEKTIYNLKGENNYKRLGHLINMSNVVAVVKGDYLVLRSNDSLKCYFFLTLESRSIS